MKIPDTFNRMGINADVGPTPPPPPEPIPTSGLVFYTPASGAFPEYSETEQYLEYVGTLTPANKDNIACFHVSEGSICSWDVVKLPYGNEPFTMSVWACMDTDVGDAANEVLSMGVTEYYQAAYIGAGHMYSGHGEAKFGDHLPDIWCANTIEKDEWYHLLQTYDGEYFNCYIKGVLVSSEYCTDMNLSYGIICVGGGGEGVFSEWWHGYFTAPRVYNRVLTSGEIDALAHEFTPMTVPTFNDQTITFTNDVGATTTPLRYNAGSKTVSFDILSGTLPNTVTFNPSGSFTYDGTTIAASATYSLVVQLSGAEVVTTSANVTIEMLDHEEIPTRGLTMWHSLSSSLTHPEIGDDFELTDDSITLTTNQGIHCAQYIGNYGGLRNTIGSYYNTSNTEVTVSVWAKYTGDTSDYWMDVCPMSIGNWANSDAQIEISMMNYGNLGTRIKVQNASDYNLTGYFSGWHHYAATLSGNGSNPKLYIDGEYIGEQDVYGNQIDVIQAVGIGGSLGSDNYIPRDRPWVGYIAGCRIYNRALEPNEILKLAGEYIPLTEPLFGTQEFNFSNSEGASSRSMWFDVENKTPVFTVVSGSLPNGVTMDSTLGTFAYDGTTIAQDEDIQVVVELSGNYVSPASAVVTFKMTDNAIVDTNDYFYMENIGDNANGAKIIKAGNPTNPITVEWSKDKSSWYEFILDGNSIPLAVNEKVYFRGNNSTFSDSNGVYSFWVDNNNDYGYAHHNVGGNIMSLLDKTCQSTTLPTSYVFKELFHPNGWSNWWVYNSYDLKLPAMTMTDHCYEAMFYECYHMVTHPELPASSLAESCYYAMFRSTQLQTAPILSAANCAQRCYARMFEYCHALQTAPELTGSTAYECYNDMFIDCSALTTPPSVLPDPNPYWAYGGMFYGCTALTDSPVIMVDSANFGQSVFKFCSSLSSITVPNMTQWGGADDTTDWVEGVAAEGVFNCPPALPKEFGNSRIPVGWKKNPDLLYFKANEDNSAVALNGYGTPPQITLSTSFDGANWSQYIIGDVLELQHTGDKVFFKGNNSEFSTSTSNYYHFKLSGSIDADGNIMSLLKEDGDLYELPSGSSYTFNYLFAFLSALHSAPELPATTLNPHCYDQMFQSCSNLTTPPELPAMTMTYRCYANMFRQSGLSAYPKLPATILDRYCYSVMFQGVPASGSVTLPALSAAEYCYSHMFNEAHLNSVNIHLTDLKNGCCSNMFKDCGDLNSISVKFTDWSPTAQPPIFYPFNNWVQGVDQSQPTGTFSCPSGLSEEYGDNRIPSGWTYNVVNIPDDYVFYWSMTDKDAATTETGESLTQQGGIENYCYNTTIQGIPCIYVGSHGSDSYIWCTDANMPSGNSDRTLSIWLYFDSRDNYGLFTYGIVGYLQWYRATPCGVDLAYIGMGVDNYFENADTQKWYNIVQTWKWDSNNNEGTFSVYINGSLFQSTTWSDINTTVNDRGFLILGDDWDSPTQNQALTAVRMYDRVLDQHEIEALANEFTPTP